MSKKGYKIKHSLGFKPQTTAPADPEDGDIYLKDDNRELMKYKGGSWKPIGSGGGDVNLIENGDGSSGTQGFSTGSYSAAARPASAFTPSSGTGSFELLTTQIEPLGTGTTSLVFKKSSGANRQGRAIQTEFDIPLEYRAAMLQIKAEYVINSGAFVAGSSSTDSSMIFYVATSPDGTTWTMIEPTSFKLLSSSTDIADTYLGFIQTPADTTKMRLIAYVAETASSAWEVKANVSVSKSKLTLGSIITDWQAYTPVISAVSGTLTNYSLSGCAWKRVGSDLYVRGGLAFTGSPGTWNLPLVSLPAGLANSDSHVIGNARYTKYSVNNYVGWTPTLLANKIMLGIRDNTTNALAEHTQSFPFTYAKDDYMTWSAGPISIQGWSAGAQVSEGYDGRVVAFRAYGEASSVTVGTTATRITSLTKIAVDTVGGWDAVNNEYKFKSSGLYLVRAGLYTAFLPENARVTLSTGGAANGEAIVMNNGGTTREDATPHLSLIQEFKADDVLYLQALINSGTVSVGQWQLSYFEIIKLSPSAYMAPTEVVSAKWYNDVSQSIANGGSFADFPKKVWDSHGGQRYDSGQWRWYAPVAGEYEVVSRGVLSNVTTSGLQLFYINLIVNGAINNTVFNGRYDRASASDVPMQNVAPVRVKLKAGDYITIQFYQETGSTKNTNVISGRDDLCNITIQKVGPY